MPKARTGGPEKSGSGGRARGCTPRLSNVVVTLPGSGPNGLSQITKSDNHISGIQFLRMRVYNYCKRPRIVFSRKSGCHFPRWVTTSWAMAYCHRAPSFCHRAPSFQARISLSPIATLVDLNLSRSERFVIVGDTPTILICRDTMPTANELQQQRLKTNSTKPDPF